MVLYDIERRIELCEDCIRQAPTTHERHFYEDRLAHLVNLYWHPKEK